LKHEFQRKTSEAESTRHGLEEAECILKEARELLSKLTEEKHRWNSQLHLLDQSKQILWKHSVLAAAFITYLASKDQSHRKKALEVSPARAQEV